MRFTPTTPAVDHKPLVNSGVWFVYLTLVCVELWSLKFLGFGKPRLTKGGVWSLWALGHWMAPCTLRQRWTSNPVLMIQKEINHPVVLFDFGKLSVMNNPAKLMKHQDRLGSSMNWFFTTPLRLPRSAARDRRRGFTLPSSSWPSVSETSRWTTNGTENGMERKWNGKQGRLASHKVLRGMKT